MDINKTIGHNIKELRTTNTDLTQQQVAEQINCTRDMYSKIEIGYSSLTTEKLIKLCTLFKCTPNNIYKGLY